MKKFKCTNIIGPYSGPFCDNILTAVLESSNIRIVWHSGPNKFFDFKKGEVYSGIVIKKSGCIDYKNSKPIKLQLELL